MTEARPVCLTPAVYLPMPEVHRGAAEPPGSVRTPALLSCPICRTTPLRGRQTVCSPRCRAKRHRQRRDEARHARDAEIRELEAALRRLTETE